MSLPPHQLQVPKGLLLRHSLSHLCVSGNSAAAFSLRPLIVCSVQTHEQGNGALSPPGDVIHWKT